MLEVSSVLERWCSTFTQALVRAIFQRYYHDAVPVRNDSVTLICTFTTFAGYFTLPLLVHANAKHVHACELNPDSVVALRRGLVANGVADRCTVHPGDNQLSAPKLAGTCDRVHLGLIPSSELAWPLACDALRRDKPGMLHVHAKDDECVKQSWCEHLHTSPPKTQTPP